MEEPRLRDHLSDLLSSQRLAVLATHADGQPYTSLVAFAATDDLRCLVFATERGTRKHANLAADSRAALLVDNRSNDEADFARAIAVTAIGQAEEAGGVEKERLLALYLAKHPELKVFAASPASALIRVAIRTYYVVSEFQRVEELRVAE
ncbi:MAG: pyridoxamine 5'-phosphate oxidase family protein [Armatimonadota bacterium]|nr:MAG: pyridoxamine 5'-phosphate oxidase family protein [Armatimonadota bacterium]